METDDPAWPEIDEAVAAAPYPVEVLAADPARADDELVRVQVTTRSWLGAVVQAASRQPMPMTEAMALMADASE